MNTCNELLVLIYTLILDLNHLLDNNNSPYILIEIHNHILHRLQHVDFHNNQLENILFIYTNKTFFSLSLSNRSFDPTCKTIHFSKKFIFYCNHHRSHCFHTTIRKSIIIHLQTSCCFSRHNKMSRCCLSTTSFTIML